MQFQYQIRLADENDLTSMQELLRENNQKPSIVVNNSSIFLLAQSGTKNIGMIGAEISGTSALIRSAAVLNPWRNSGIGNRLVESLFEELKKKGMAALYLFSRDSGVYWQKYGFTSCSIQQLIDNLPDANQVIGYINDNSIWTDVAWYKKLE